jgi:uncharacterized protein DUF5329
MNIRSAVKFGLAPGLLLASLAMAAPTADVQAEIEYLLRHIEDSGCEFYRNGSWYNGGRARAHLYEKYRYFVAHGGIITADEFIERAATRSSVTGIPYQIRCSGGAPIDSKPWLLDALAAYRQAKSAAPPPLHPLGARQHKKGAVRAALRWHTALIWR